MGLREDKFSAIRWERPERIPVQVGIMPAAWMKYRERLDEIVQAHPDVACPARTGSYDDVANDAYRAGESVDAWGCVWGNAKTGVSSIVVRHPVPTREAVHGLKAPAVDIGTPHGFMFLRLADLRGFEELMADFAEEPPELQLLIDKVLEYNLRQVNRKLAALNGGGPCIVWFGDDLGMQTSLPISPDTWRKYLKPCYARLYAPVKARGDYVYMHTDGHILEIIPDLRETGVDVLNAQVGANGLADLARVCKRRICVDLDLDRQRFPFWKPADIDRHVREAVEALGAPEGGLWLKAEVAEDVPLENIEAIFQALETYREYRW